MTKFDIYGDGTIIDVSYQEFLRFLAQLAETCFSLAKSYIVNHASGLADFDNEYFGPNMDRVHRQFLVASDGMEDELLREKMSVLIRLLEILSDTDAKITMAYRDELGEKESEVNHEPNLKKRIFTHIHSKHRSPPTLVIQLAQESGKMIPELEDLRQIILEKIEQLTTFEQE